jgi:uncharacterized protein (TIGR02680 family)
MAPSTTAVPERLPAPERERWSVLRAGIQNVWEYDDRRFVFNRGRLLLRGQNEAGKTKAMELLFPFLLDADLAPQRLDPFGSTARPMRWNLINEANPESQLRIGYLWIELGRVEAGKPAFCTIGAGVKARRGSPEVDAWFFVTSQRPDAEVRFAADGRPLGKRECVEAIGKCGQVFERHGEYRRAVNARLFGMPDEQYAALVDTLLHLRRPQLSKTLDLGELSGFLSASLPPLDRRVVDPIAEGFERLDHHRADLEALLDTLGKLHAFEEVYREYARAVAKGRAQAVSRAESAYQRARAEARERAADRDALLARRREAEEVVAELGRRERALLERSRALEASEAYRAAKDLDEAEEFARRAAAAAGEATRRAREDGRLREEAEERAASAANETRERTAEAERARAVASAAAKEAALAGPHAAVESLAAKGETEVAAGALRAIRAERDLVLRRLRALAAALAAAVEAHRRAEERAREREADLETWRASLRDAERLRDEAEEAWVAAAEAWADRLRVLPRAAIPATAEDGAPVDPAGFRAAAAAAAEPVRRNLADERAAAGARLAATRAEADSLRAERDALARAPHPTPPAPAWRSPRPADRPGAPLYLLCDFGPGAAGSEAAIEAALESSGLLDAWVEPDGTLRDPRTGDAVLRGPACGGRSLADVLHPVAAGGVAEERAREALRSVAFADAGETPEAVAWISPDGRWRLGPVHGAWTKDRAAYVGATARERERERRIAEVDARVEALEATARALEEEVNRAGERLDLLAAELASLPDGAPLEAARARVGLRAEAHAEAQRRRGEAEQAFADAETARARAASELDRAAAEAGLAAFARDPEALAERTRAWAEAAEARLATARELRRARGSEEREARAAREAAERAERSREGEARAAEESAAAGARARALRETSGKDRDEVLAALREARAGAEAARTGREGRERELRALGEEVGKAREAAGRAEAAVADREEDRKAAAGALRALVEAGLLAASGFAAPDPSRWSFTVALELAREVDGAVEGAGTPEERERAQDRLMRRERELAFQLPADVRILSSLANEVLSYEFSWNGRTRRAAEVVAEMEADAGERRALLGDEESRLLEGFLSGEAHDHLASRLREARALVDRMNAALEERTTAAGAQVRLAWDLDEAGAQADAREAVPLFLRAGHLLTEANRAGLRDFLQRRLAQAREAQGDRSLHERLLEVLDYRSWYRFEVEHRTPGQPWAKLTRKAHAAGSGGKKAVMLHLPLFAAAAAFYDSAGPAAPRIIALDEAFAGIDRPTRGKLMGLLAEFDLDFVMTSFEEWGFYEELDGLSTYHLAREPGHRGVFAEWFLWNGRERVLVEES